MTDTDEATVLHVPARDIPVPTSVSPEAQAMLAAGVIEGPPQPPIDDLDAWRKMIAETDELVLSLLGGDQPADVGVERTELDGIPAFIITPAGVAPDDRRIHLDIHGGAFINGAGELCRVMGTRTALEIGLRVAAVDYRMPPDHPYPVPLDDCVAAYRGLLAIREPHEISVGGGSAGGNLAPATVLRARDEGLPLPAAALISTPAGDLTASGDTISTLEGVDTVLSGSLEAVSALYAGGHDRTHPYVSPVFGDYTKGFPPTMLTSGTRDRLLSDTVRIHRALRAAGIHAELHVVEAAPHGGFMVPTPEGDELAAEIRRFLEAQFAAAAEA